MAKKIQDSEKAGKDEFLEQLIIRRELAINFVYYNKNYNKFSCIPEWAQETLKKHEEDKRDYDYSKEELENAETHDPYWNAAQNQLVKLGKMKPYMRRYWGKKIL